MTNEEIAASIIACLGGTGNIQSNALCMTRLRIQIIKPSLVDEAGLNDISGVLGSLKLGDHGIEIVCRPTLVQAIFESFSRLTGLSNNFEIRTRAGIGATLDNSEVLKVQISNPKASSQRTQEQQLKPMLHQTTFDPHHVNRMTSEAEELTKLLLENDKKISLNKIAHRKALHTSNAGGKQQKKTHTIASGEKISTRESKDHKTCATEALLPYHILILNGPNINMLGIREPTLYGRSSYEQLIQLCKHTAKELGFASCKCYQSNHEGDLVDMIQQAYGNYQGIVFNPGAYTHTSIALLDALKAVNIPTVEVHITNIDERDEFRKISYIRAACFKSIIGEGIDGYKQAICALAEKLGSKHSS